MQRNSQQDYNEQVKCLLLNSKKIGADSRCRFREKRIKLKVLLLNSGAGSRCRFREKRKNSQFRRTPNSEKMTSAG